MATDDLYHSDMPVRKLLSNRLSSLASRLNRQANVILDEHAGIGLPEWRIIAMLASQGGLTPSALSSISGMDLGLVSRTLKNLKGRTLVDLQIAEEDRRRSRALLTKKGKQLFERTFPIMRARQESLLNALNPSEREMLFDILDKLDVVAEARDFQID